MASRPLRAAAAASLIAALSLMGRGAGAAPTDAAPPAAPTPAAKKSEANHHFDQGKAYYRAGAYDLAVQEFLAGYEIDPRPGVLFNIGRAYEELKNRAKAIEYFNKYVAAVGSDAPAVTEAKARVVALQRQAREEDVRQQAQAQAEAQAATERAARERAQREEALRAQAAAGSATAGSGGTLRTEAPPSSPELAAHLKIGGIAAAGAGLVLTGVGVLLAVRGNHLNDEIRTEIARTQTWSTDLSSKDADMKTANRWALITAVSGGVAIAGGAVLYYL